jgi:serine/threonine protein kinase
VFAQASDLTASQRSAFLDDACRDDAEVRREVQSLLDALETRDVANGSDPTGSTTPPQTAQYSRATADFAPHAEPAGGTIGTYKLHQLIGEGGFGAVYLAEQTHPVQRKVALKIIKLGMDTRQVIARFEQERQALAVMDHPNIAKVHDAGATGNELWHDPFIPPPTSSSGTRTHPLTLR